MWIKICGLSDAAAVDAAVAAGVAAVGFVFAASPRQVTPVRAAALARPARRAGLACVAVTRQPLQQEIDEILQDFAPDLLQSDAQDLSRLRLPATLALLPVLRSGSPLPGSLPPRLLFEGPRSGVGKPCDWDAAQAVARGTQLVLAGGLHAGNVATAIAAVRPWGVDVSSGVELRPGLKDPAAIVSFAQAARAAP
ncbi:MAG: phosphoribosylanthranilate isomerase [Proteobacteria bacterium]|nr:phosphoribosylanthranilate isomerase [Pseudomonadota bacterium]